MPREPAQKTYVQKLPGALKHSQVIAALRFSRSAKHPGSARALDVRAAVHAGSIRLAALRDCTMVLNRRALHDGTSWRPENRTANYLLFRRSLRPTWRAASPIAPGREYTRKPSAELAVRDFRILSRPAANDGVLPPFQS